MSRNVTDVSLGLDYSDGDGAPDSTASTQADGMDELPASVPEGSNAIADAPDRLAESGEQHDSEDDAASRDFIVEPFYDDLPPSDPYDAAEGL